VKVLVTGGAGYIGCRLVQHLLDAGHTVRVLDAFHWGREVLAGMDVELIEGRIERLEPSDDRFFADVDAVCHMAGFSNDPTADFAPDLNQQVNVTGTIRVAEAAARCQVKHFTFASSASVYDRPEFAEMDEPPIMGAYESSIEPVGHYSLSKAQAEQELFKIARRLPHFKPTVFRQGTVFGWSPRMRFDLVVNTLVRDALLHGEIAIHGEGLNWRPMLDIEHCAAAHVTALENDYGSGLVNLSTGNIQIRDIAQLVRAALSASGRQVEIRSIPLPEGRRARNYRMDCSSMVYASVDTLETAIYGAAAEMIERYERATPEELTDPRFANIEWMAQRMAAAS
jgi:nucleoside-diphosphate-sugar epimerase